MRQIVISHLDADARFVWLSECPPPYTAEQVLGKRPWDFHDSENATIFRAAYALVVTERQIQNVDLRISHIGRWKVALYPCHHPLVRIVCVGQQAPRELDLLTDRHLAVCRELSRGFGTMEIAAKLDLSRGTIDNYKSEISSRIGIPARALPAWCGANAMWF